MNEKEFEQTTLFLEKINQRISLLYPLIANIEELKYKIQELYSGIKRDVIDYCSWELLKDKELLKKLNDFYNRNYKSKVPWEYHNKIVLQNLLKDILQSFYKDKEVNIPEMKQVSDLINSIWIYEEDSLDEFESVIYIGKERGKEDILSFLVYGKKVIDWGYYEDYSVSSCYKLNISSKYFLEEDSLKEIFDTVNSIASSKLSSTVKLDDSTNNWIISLIDERKKKIALNLIKITIEGIDKELENRENKRTNEEYKQFLERKTALLAEEKIWESKMNKISENPL